MEKSKFARFYYMSLNWDVKQQNLEILNSFLAKSQLADV